MRFIKKLRQVLQLRHGIPDVVISNHHLIMLRNSKTSHHAIYLTVDKVKGRSWRDMLSKASPGFMVPLEVSRSRAVYNKQLYMVGNGFQITGKLVYVLPGIPLDG